MNRSSCHIFALLACAYIGVLGCNKKSDAPAPPIAETSQIPDLVKQLRETQSPLGRRAVLNQIASLGTEANTPEVLKALEDVRKKVTGKERNYVEQTIAKVKGTPAPAGDGKK